MMIIHIIIFNFRQFSARIIDQPRHCSVRSWRRVQSPPSCACRPRQRKVEGAVRIKKTRVSKTYLVYFWFEKCLTDQKDLQQWLEGTAALSLLWLASDHSAALTSSKNSLSATENNALHPPNPPCRRWFSPKLDVSLISLMEQFFTIFSRASSLQGMSRNRAIRMMAAALSWHMSSYWRNKWVSGLACVGDDGEGYRGKGESCRWGSASRASCD